MCCEVGARRTSSSRRTVYRGGTHIRALCSTPKHIVNVRFQHLTEGRIQKCLGEISNMFWNPFANEEHRKVMSEIIAVMQEKIIGLVSTYERLFPQH